jgi:DNA recombination protein RmuC
LHDALQRYDTQVQALEARRQHAYGSLEEQLGALARSNAELQREAGNLVAALRAPQVRGRWGEITLRRVVELAGMANRCDFVEQVTVEGEEGRLRPDMVVHLPAGRDIVVDAKVPLAAYLDATMARTPEERNAALARHVQQVRQHVSRLAEKAYWEQFPSAPELVVMFVPLEAAIATALELDGSLLEDGMGRKVLPATPVTLMGLLLTIAYGWRQEQIATNAAQISALGRELYERIRGFAGHFEDVGDKLGKATAAYNRAVGSMESRVLPSARRFRDLGAATGDDIAMLDTVDTQPRPLSVPEIPRQLSTTDPVPDASA